MLDKLGPSILSKPTQIVSFAINIIDSYVDKMTTGPKEKPIEKSSFPDITRIVSEEEKEALEDESSNEEDVESLILAINLLRAVMHGKLLSKQSRCPFYTL